MKAQRQKSLIAWFALLLCLPMIYPQTITAQSSVHRLIAKAEADLENWDIHSAMSNAQRAVEKSARRPEKPAYQDALLQLGRIHSAIGEYVQAEKLLAGVLAHDEKIGDTLSLRHGAHQLDYAHHLLQYGIWGKGYRHLLTAWRIDSSSGTPANNLGPLLPLNLAYLHGFFLDNHLAEKFQVMARQRLDAMVNAPANLEQMHHQIIAVGLHKAGLTTKAIEIQSANLQADTAVKGLYHPRQIQALSLLASYYLGSGELTLAEELELKAIQAAKALYPKPNTLLIDHSIKYAAILFAQGRLVEMRANLLDAVQVIKATSDSVSAQLALAEFFLGHFAAGQGDFVNSIPHYEASINIYKAMDLPPTSPFAFGMQLLMNSYSALGMTEQITQTATEVIAIAAALPPTQNIIDRNNLAIAYQHLGRLPEAAQVLHQQLALDSLHNNFGPIHLLTLYNLVVNLQMQKDYPNAGKFLPSLVVGTTNLLFKYRNLLGEQENKAIWNDHAITLLLCNSLIFQGDSNLNHLADLGYAATNFQKGYLLRSTRSLQAALHASTDPELRDDWMTYLRSNAAFIQGQSGQDINDEHNAIQLERKLLARLEPFADLQQALFVSADSVRAALHPHEAVIEFVLYSRSDIEAPQPEYWYGAYIILPNASQPHVVPLCSHAELQTALLASGSSSGALYRSPNRGVKPVKSSQQSSSKSLYDLIWEPLEGHVKDVKSIYYSPDGLLHQIAFDAVQTPSKERLGTRHHLHRMASTSALSRGRSQMYADMVQSAQIYADMITTALGKDTTSASQFPPLPATRIEAESMAEKMRDMGKKASLFLGSHGTESTLYHSLMASKSEILHIATHGVVSSSDSIHFKTELLDIIRVAGADGDPLSQCGLVFHPEIDSAQQFQMQNCDGFLSGSEISRLDLRNTRLVVLSACQTGIGEIQGAEGIYGLQRAFFIAGVDFVIASLWKVPDMETAEFMQHFYRAFFEGIELHAAFREAQGAMSQLYPDQPEKWAAFVLIE